MDTKAISALVIRSSRQYIEFLEEQPKREDRGEEAYDVVELIRYENGAVRLKLKKNLTDLSLTRIEIDGKRIDEKLYEYRSYDDISKTLVMEVNETIREKFTSENKDKIKVISDFKFLMERIIEFMEEFGAEHLRFPSEGAHKIENLELPESLSSNEDQKAAIESSLIEPASYIWGAPGTGKTQYVLAKSILADIKAGKKVAVFAPTNNSVEQVLMGLIKEIKSNEEYSGHINLDKDVLRAGFASSRFQSTFPKICEQRFAIKGGKVLKATFKALKETRDEMIIDDNEEKLRLLQKRVKNYDSLDDFEQDKIVDEFNEILDTFKGIGAIKPALLSASKLDIEGSLKRIIDAAVKRSRPRRYMPDYEGFSIEDMNGFIEGVEDEYVKRTGKYLSGKGVHKNYISSDFSASLEKGKVDENNPETLINETADTEGAGASLKSAKLIVCTPHQFFKRMVPECAGPRGKKHVLDVGHIYVDEAGYANLMHVLPLLTNHCPITLLGDHMQLETVFKMGRQKAINNFKSEKGKYPLAFLWGTSAIHLEDMFSRGGIKEVQRIYEENKDPDFKLVKLIKLKKSYRFGENLARILDENVYGNMGLQGASECDNLLIECIPVNGKAARYENCAEADVINEFIKLNGIIDSTVVLAPYNKQVQSLYSSKGKTDYEVMTIHKSQGREWDTVIISVTDSELFESSFMNSMDPEHLKVINTAVSRAKKRLIIVCNYKNWASYDGQLISELVKYANDNGNCYTSIGDIIKRSTYGDEIDY